MFAEASQYNHQKVVLDVDFSGNLRGYTDITIIPATKELKTLHLHSRQCLIHSVTVGSYSADFAFYDPLASIPASDLSDCHRHPELKRKLYSSLAESDEGELAISIPKAVTIRNTGRSSTAFTNEAATPEPPTPSILHASTPSQEFLPIVVHVEYSLRNPVDGIQFALPTDAYPYRVPHVYTTPSSPAAARCWVPCLDNLWERCTWEFEFIVPKYLEEQEINALDLDGEDVGQDGANNPTIVICSGELVEQVAHPFNSSKTIFLFSQPVATSAQHVAFAAGPFHVFPISNDGGLPDDTLTSQTLMHAFCLPGHEAYLASSVSFLCSAMHFYSTEYGSYPFGSYKLVFVDELPNQKFDSATLSILSVDLLHGDDAIDQVYETRQILSHALACQWMGINILPKAWSDTWLTNGLGLYITGLFLRRLFGNNEYRFRMRKDMDRVLEYDNGSMPPICQPSNAEPPDPALLPFINLKAPIVLHILDRRLGKSGTSLGLSRVLPKVFLSAISGEMTQNLLSTHSFLRTCRKVSGADLRPFVDQWVFGSGCPQFSFSATFNRKKMAVEIQMRQECPAFVLHERDPIALALLKPASFFEGQMTVRIHEADGTPYEHVLDILAPTKRFEVPFNTKYKRVRRNTKRYLARQAAAQAAAEGDTEAAEAIGMIDMGFGLEVWENEAERERWRVADWTEEEEQAMAGATYEWIRMDADFEWIAKVQFEQADYMWVSQLQRDRDVVAQYEAVHALAKAPTAIVSSTLTKTVLVTNYFYRIRCEAAAALVTCAIRRLDFIGLFHLFKLFLRYCYDLEDPDEDLFQHKYVPRPNDFSDFPAYFVRKALLNAISQVRFENGKTPSVVRQFFIDQLRYNDNTTNSYSDAYYICAVISALACATVSTAAPERGELLKTETKTEQNAEDVNLLNAAITEVERYRSMDRLIPSAHNVVTVAVIEFYILISMASLVPNDLKIFLTSTREGNATQVRLAAFDGLFLCKWYTPKIMRYVFAVIANDPSRVVRRHVARNFCQSLALLAGLGEFRHAAKDNDSVMIEEDGSLPEKTKEAKKSEVDNMIRALRKDREVGRSDVLRECLMPVILDPQADNEVRWCLLKLADLAIRGQEEPVPKVVIHLPPTPVTEVPPLLPPPEPPVIKLISKSKPSVKITAKKNSVPTPTTPLAATSKSRILHPSIPLSSEPAASLHVSGYSEDNEATVRAVPEPTPIPKKKEKSSQKGQLGGMSATELITCRNVLKRLVVNKYSVIFRQAVDPIRDAAPNYFDIIKNPIDLSTISAKLEAGMYKDLESFEADFRLMVNNCHIYNPAGSYADNEAVALESFFDKQWARVKNTLKDADKAVSQHQPIPVPVKSRTKDSEHKALAPTVAENTPAVASSASKPTITLKLNASAATSKPKQEAPKLEAPKLKIPKARRPANADAPAKSYVDDGSDDLLQEVIAIEREKGESSSRTPVREPIDSIHNDMDEDDEILNLATVSAPIKPSNSRSPVPLQPHPPMPAVKETPKPKKEAKQATNRPTPTPTVASKAKEKEPVNASPVPSKIATPAPRANSATTTPINEKKCKEILRQLVKLDESFFFREPVDPVRDGCPTYYDEIKEPMDLSTMKGMLERGEFATMESFARAMDLIFTNCRQFNPGVGDPVRLAADALERAFRKEWTKAVEKKLAFQEKRNLQGTMTKLLNDKQWWIFWEPVDPVLLDIPTYFDVIPKKDVRDLRTIRAKLDADKYDSIDAWAADMDLMVQNAIKFNGELSDVGQVGVALRERVRVIVDGFKNQQQGKKRQGESPAETPTRNPKKPKVI